MRAPSTKTLISTFGISADAAKAIRALAASAGDGERLRVLVDERSPATARYVRSLHSDPYALADLADHVALHAINEHLGTYGVEGLGPPRSGDYAPPYEYLNAGDTYSTTLIYDRDRDRLFVGSWGDLVEKHPEWEGQPRSGRPRRAVGRRGRSSIGTSPRHSDATRSSARAALGGRSGHVAPPAPHLGRVRHRGVQPVAARDDPTLASARAASAGPDDHVGSAGPDLGPRRDPPRRPGAPAAGDPLRDRRGRVDRPQRPRVGHRPGVRRAGRPRAASGRDVRARLRAWVVRRAARPPRAGRSARDVRAGRVAARAGLPARDVRAGRVAAHAGGPRARHVRAALAAAPRRRG